MLDTDTHSIKSVGATEFVRLFGRTHENILCHAHKLIPVYFYKFSKIAYGNRLWIMLKQIDFILTCVIEGNSILTTMVYGYVWIDLFEFIYYRHKHFWDCLGDIAYENNLWHVHKLFLAYFHKFFKIAYENCL